MEGTEVNKVEPAPTAEAIFEQYGDYLLRVIRFHVRDEAHAHDLLQEFFLRLLEKPVPPGVNHMKKYLYTILTRDIIDAQRRLITYRRKLMDYASQQLETRSPREPNRKHVQDEVDKMFELVEKNLPRREATAVTLRYRDNCDLDEMAQKMGINARSISRYISVGLRKLRKALTP